MQLPTNTKNPYCEFKNDRERRNALIARDIRIVLVSLVVAVSGTPVSRNLVGWFFG